MSLFSLRRHAVAATAFLGAVCMPNNIGAQPEAKPLPSAAIRIPRMALTAPMPEGIPCRVRPEYTDLVYRLPNLTRRLETGDKVTIVALGSSSTEGVGASSRFMSYPARLQDELRRMFQTDAITVINRGTGGEKAGDMLARLERDVLSENPDLVIFQGDVNTVLANAPMQPAIDAMDNVLRQLRARGIDVVLMDAQYAPRVDAMPQAGPMQDAVAALGRRHRVGVFPRHALMQAWQDQDALAYDQFLAPDRLHMKDWGYACAARVLAHAIGQAGATYRYPAVRMPAQSL